MTRKKMIAILQAAHPAARIVYSRRFGGPGTLPKGWWAQYPNGVVSLGSSLSLAIGTALFEGPYALRG